MEKIRAVIFECDGVVIDSGADMADAMNATLGHFGMKQLSEKEIVSFVGNGARMLVMRAVKSSIGFAGMNASDIPPERMKQILDWYTEYYYAHAVERTVLYPGYAELLEKMMLNKGIVLTRDQLLTEIWGYDFDGETRTVDVHVRTLRQKLGEKGDLVQTVRGVGHRVGEEQ